MTLRSVEVIAKAGWHLIRSYSAAVPRIAYRSTLSLVTNPLESQRFVHQVLSAVDLSDDDPMLGSVNVVDVLPGNGDVEIVGSYYSPNVKGTAQLVELATLAYIVKTLRPQLVIEMGTFEGRTTRILARALPAGGRVITIDLSGSRVEQEIGAAFAGTPEAEKIQQVFGDTRTLNFEAWYGQSDFVWVDACHDYPFVVSDTKEALKLCRPGGVVAWHDYRHTARWSGVTRAVRELTMRGLKPVHVRGTTIAVLQTPR